MRVVAATHGHCMDGLASAALFTHLVRTVEGPDTTFVYRACGYGEGQTTATPAVLSGDQNAILDYRFSASEHVTWFFDHHQTAFVTEADREFFEQRRQRGRYFHEPECSSCAKLIAQVATTRFGVDLARLEELIRWADVIDSAAFDTPEQALDRSNPVLRLAAVVERHGDDALITELVPQLLERPLAEIADSAAISSRYRQIAAQHERFVQCVRDRAERRGRVVLVDLTEESLETIGKFVTYALYPDATYSVIVGQVRKGAKISVGYNPWSGEPRCTDISAICARYGGGGHPFVGAVQFGAGQIAEARKAARDIAAELAK